MLKRIIMHLAVNVLDYSLLVFIFSQFHPDRKKGSHTKFVSINEAYSVIGRPESRKSYDRLISNMNSGQFNLQNFA